MITDWVEQYEDLARLSREMDAADAACRQFRGDWLAAGMPD